MGEYIRQEHNQETFFPLELVRELVQILKGKNCVFQTYSDLKICLVSPPFDRISYMLEYHDFIIKPKSLYTRYLSLLKYLVSRLAFGARVEYFDKYRINQQPAAIFQHDADNQPYKTVELLKYEAALGIRSSAYFFKKQNLSDEYEPYLIDIESLKELEDIGFEIGYHLNAYELASYDLIRAFEIIKSDIDFFSQHFNLRTFVPHGGIPSPEGLNNEHIPYTGILRKYIWAYNKLGVSSDKIWSDGSILFEDLNDPREMALSLKDGERIIFVMHPQYYGDKLSPTAFRLPVSENAWWRNLWGV